jgi:hypothetical protein
VSTTPHNSRSERAAERAEANRKRARAGTHGYRPPSPSPAEIRQRRELRTGRGIEHARSAPTPGPQYPHMGGGRFDVEECEQ